jgi:hypothetical protein
MGSFAGRLDGSYALSKGSHKRSAVGGKAWNSAFTSPNAPGILIQHVPAWPLLDMTARHSDSHPQLLTGK